MVAFSAHSLRPSAAAECELPAKNDNEASSKQWNSSSTDHKLISRGVLTSLACQVLLFLRLFYDIRQFFSYSRTQLERSTHQRPCSRS